MSVRAAEVYGYDAPHGHRIAVTAIEGEPDTAHLTCGLADHGMMTAAVRDGDVPQVAREILRGLHEAAGLPVPIVLDRPELLGTTTILPSCTVGCEGGTEAGTVLVVSDDDLRLSPAEAHNLAAVIAARADEAEQAASSAQVHALATVMRLAYPGMAVPSDGDYGMAVCREMAKVILARFDITERQP